MKSRFALAGGNHSESDLLRFISLSSRPHEKGSISSPPRSTVETQRRQSPSYLSSPSPSLAVFISHIFKHGAFSHEAKATTQTSYFCMGRLPSRNAIQHVILSYPIPLHPFPSISIILNFSFPFSSRDLSFFSLLMDLFSSFPLSFQGA
jgi:hypothetical protein